MSERCGVLRISFQALAEALRLPDGSRIERIRDISAAEQIEVVVSHDALPERQPGDPIRMVHLWYLGSHRHNTMLDDVLSSTWELPV